MVNEVWLRWVLWWWHVCNTVTRGGQKFSWLGVASGAGGSRRRSQKRRFWAGPWGMMWHLSAYLQTRVLVQPRDYHLLSCFPPAKIRRWLSHTIAEISFKSYSLGVWDGNPIKLDCDDRCTTTKGINSLSNNTHAWVSFPLLAFWLLPCCLVFLVANLFKTILMVFLPTVVRTIPPRVTGQRLKAQKEPGWTGVHTQPFCFSIWSLSHRLTQFASWIQNTVFQFQLRLYLRKPGELTLGG